MIHLIECEHPHVSLQNYYQELDCLGVIFNPQYICDTAFVRSEAF